MPDLITRNHLELLAQTLGVEPSTIEGLARLGADNLATLRAHLSAAMFDADTQVFARIGKLAPLVPNALAAKVAVTAVPPEVAARAAGALALDNQDRITAVFDALPTEYLAAAAPYLDPRVIAPLAPELSGKSLLRVARALVASREFAICGQYLAHATPDQLSVLVAGISDDVALLCVSSTVPSPRLNEVVQQIPRDRAESIIRATTQGDDDAVLAGLSVLARLDPARRRRLAAALFDSCHDTDLARIVSVAGQSGAVEEFLTATHSTEPNTVERIANCFATQSTDTAKPYVEWLPSTSHPELLRQILPA